MKSFPIWQLQTGRDRRFRSGHPWVYSNELQGSPKGVAHGELVELRDSSGKFLARGFGNPQSLIAFRALSRKADDVEPASPAALEAKLRSARDLRLALGFTDQVSYRLCFGEADGIPGLVIDHYKLASGGRVLAMQAQSAGADRALDSAVAALRAIYADQPTFVIRNDVGIRKLEGIAVEEPRTLDTAGVLGDAELREARILVRSAGDPAAPALEFTVDLFDGQKTGFFLDQWGNIQLTLSRLGAQLRGRKEVRVLDLCSYVGQWGAQVARALSASNVAVDVTVFDASESALALARKNVTAAGARKVSAVRGDVFEDLKHLGETFDLVICDPPALIKGRKDVPQGKHAYLQLNTQAMAKLAPKGAIVTCSCSALLEEPDFASAITRAAARNSRQIAWIARGGPSPDHPMRLEFTEGHYLKAWIGVAQQ